MEQFKIECPEHPGPDFQAFKREFVVSEEAGASWKSSYVAVTAIVSSTLGYVARGLVGSEREPSGGTLVTIIALAALVVGLAGCAMYFERWPNAKKCENSSDSETKS